MNSELHKLLKSCDVLGAWEFPPGANWDQSIDEIRSLKMEVDRVLGVPTRLDDQVQDASFFADLGVLKQLPSPDKTLVLSYDFCLRFSWFSRLFTVFGDRWTEYDMSRIFEVLNKNGFVYVPSSELDELYDGINEPFETGLTWWIRYFDYL